MLKLVFSPFQWSLNSVDNYTEEFFVSLDSGEKMARKCEGKKQPFWEVFALKASLPEHSEGAYYYSL